MNDSKIDAYYLVFNLLTMFFNEKKKVTYETLLKFFDAFGTYFEESDKQVFLNEVHYIKRDREEIDLRELASMIRDDVENFPK